MSSRDAHAKLQPGRVVLLAHPTSGATDLAVLVGWPDMDLGGSKRGGGKGREGLFAPKRPLQVAAAVGGNEGASTPGRRLWVLALHHKGPQDPPPGKVEEGAAQAVAAQGGRGMGLGRVGLCVAGLSLATRGRRRL